MIAVGGMNATVLWFGGFKDNVGLAHWVMLISLNYFLLGLQ